MLGVSEDVRTKTVSGAAAGWHAKLTTLAAIVKGFLKRCGSLTASIVTGSKAKLWAGDREELR